MPSSDPREYVAVHGCVRVLTAAVVAVMVAVGDASRPPLPWRGVAVAVGCYRSAVPGSVERQLWRQWAEARQAPLDECPVC
jgi:hypothetical protein